MFPRRLRGARTTGIHEKNLAGNKRIPSAIVLDLPAFVPLHNRVLPLTLSLRLLHSQVTLLRNATATGTERSSRGYRDVGERALLAERLQPCTAVKFSVVLDDETVATDFHDVDAVDGIGLGAHDSPSPGDGVAVVPDVEDVEGNLGLEDTLPVVESGLAGEADGAELEGKLANGHF